MYKFCNNCGKSGHLFKQCRQRIKSYGVIVFHNGPNGDEPLKYLFIRRKFSIAYIEFVRGRYIYDKNEKTCLDTKYLRYIFENMTKEERSKIVKNDFDELWAELWCYDKKSKKYEYHDAKAKYHAFIKGIKLQTKTVSLDSLLSETNTTFDEPEWGFPKGRKTFDEDPKTCALREFKEETDFPQEYIEIISDKPIESTYRGSNNKMYSNIYYMAKFTSPNPEDYRVLKLNPNNGHQKSEISKMAWLNIEEADKYIRPYHSMRYRVLNQVDQYILNVYYDQVNAEIEFSDNSIGSETSEEEVVINNILPNVNKFTEINNETNKKKIPPGFEHIARAKGVL